MGRRERFLAEQEAKRQEAMRNAPIYESGIECGDDEAEFLIDVDRQLELFENDDGRIMRREIVPMTADTRERYTLESLYWDYDHAIATLRYVRPKSKAKKKNEKRDSKAIAE
jgi:hypothetical protein